MTGAI